MTSLALACALLLLCQAIVLVIQKHESYHYWTALLAVSIAWVILLDLYLWRGGYLVSDLNSGFLLEQGSPVGLWMLLPTYSLVPALVLQANRAARDASATPIWLATRCIGVGIFGAWSVSKVGADFLPHSAVYGYDLYSPLLLLFITSCVTEWLVMLVGFRDRDVRSFMATFSCLGVAGLGAALAEQTSLLQARRTSEWKLWFKVLLFAFVVFAYRLLSVRIRALSVARSRQLLFRTGAVLCAAGLFFVAQCCSEAASSKLWLALFCGVGVLFALVYLHKNGQGAAVWDRSESLPVRVLLVVALTALLALSFDLFFFKLIPDSTNLFAAGIASILLIEIVSEGTLAAAASLATITWGSESALRVGVVTAAQHTYRVVKSGADWLNGQSKVVALAAKGLMLGLALMTWSEWESHNHTVVHVFNVYAPQLKDDALGKHFAEMVVTELNGISAALDENLLVGRPAASARTDAAAPLRTAFVRTGDLEAELTNTDIDLGPLGKLPLATLLRPLRAPVRALLNVRTVEGTLATDLQGFRLYAHTSTGDSWDDDTDTDPRQLALRFAFTMLSTQPQWASRGMSSDRAAFEAFSSGLTSWRNFERVAGTAEGIGLRARAIADFRAALERDPSFAMAHYRLALGLQNDGQVEDAKQHLRLALSLTPRFGSARDALARLLTSYSPYSRPQIVSPAVPPSPEALFQRNLEARKLWSGMVAGGLERWSLRDRAAAHMGLCSLAVTSATHPSTYFDGVFNCIAAERLYEAMGADQLQGNDRATLRATARNNRGVLTGRIAAADCVDGKLSPVSALPRCAPGQESDPLIASTLIGCHASLFRRDPKAGRFTWYRFKNGAHGAATELYRAAHRDLPHDAVIECNLAEAELEAGQPDRMKTLLYKPAVQSMLCNDLASTAQRQGDDPAVYAAALEACARALDVEPLDLDTLNAYAYTYRVWRFRAGPAAEGPARDPLGKRAEAYARTAVRLARGQVPLNASAPVAASVMPHEKLAIYESSLGEVLLALGRPHEAIEHLVPANAILPNHADYNEIRRDLAEALVCAEKEDEGGSDHACRDARAQAEQTLAAIRELEQPREDQPFSSDLAQLDIDWLRRKCVDPSGRATASAAP